MREHWDEAINKIDEKYIAETAETHAKHAAKQLEAEKYEAEGERPTAIAAAPVKKSSRGKVIGICSAAAAVALVAIGGGVMLSRDDSILTGDTTSEATVESTAESSESIDQTEGAEYIIDFSRSFEEGYIGFAAPEKSAWLGGNGVRGPVSDWGRADVIDYVLEISDIDITMMDNNLIDNGYILDLSDNKSYMNSLASAERQDRQITLVYTKGEAELLINLGESDDNFRYHFYGDEACRLDAAGTGSYLRSFWTGGNAVISISGMINADECSYYAVDISELEEDIFCSISARGCTTEDILDTLAGLVCDTEALTERAAEPLDLAQYGAFATSRYNVEFPLADHRVDSLKEAVFGFEEPQPVYSIGNCETLSAKLNMYRSETVDGHYEYLQLHKSANGSSLDEYYYSISDTNNTAYFRISEESYNNLYYWFASNSPAYFDGKVLAEDYIGNTTRPEDGMYLIDHDGGAIMLHDDNVFAVGDTVRVWFDGLIMESYPAQVNKIKVEKIYAAAEDESPLVPEGEEIGGFDAAVYEEYFLGQWCTMDALEYTHTFDYNSGFVDHIACGELSDGYYFCCYNGGQPEFCFIPKDCTDYMFAYGAVDLQAPQNSKRSDFYDEFYRRADIGNSLSGELNMMGRVELADRMGGNFAEVLQGLYDGFTDIEGREWAYLEGAAAMYSKPVLKDYSMGTESYYAEIYKHYADRATMTDDPHDPKTVEQWYSHFIAMVDGEYKVIATLPCDRNGNVAPDAEGKNFAEDDLYGHGVTAVFSWAGTNEFTAYPQVYVEDTNTRKVLAQTTIQNPAMFSYGGPLFEDMEIFVQDIQLKGGAVFAVLIPRSQNGPYRGYEVSFYWYDKLNKEIRLVGEADGGFFPMCMNERIETEPESNTVNIYWTDTSIRAFRFEFDTNGVRVHESELSDGTFRVDYSKGGTGKEFAVFGKAFAGKWNAGGSRWEFDLYSDNFSYADPCSFYEDDYGYFMLAEGRVWFISKDDMDHLYYFEDVQDGDELSLSDFDGDYRRTEPLQGFYGGEGEMGWFGLLDLLYTKDGNGVGVDELFDMEITDQNGNVWVRTPNRSIDWGGIYEGYVNGELVYFLKMQSKNFPDTFKYFSFNFNLPKLRNGNLVYSDEHYSFNMGIFDTNELVTDYATAAKAEAEGVGYGYFMVDTQFFTMDNGGYYAVRMMGNNGAQWLSNGEIFYNVRDFDGVEGYEKLNETNISDYHVNGNNFYRLYNRYDEEANTELWLMVYQSGRAVADFKIDDDGFVAMDAYMEINGNETKWLVIGYYDSEREADTHILFNVTDPDAVLEPITGITDIVYHDDNTMTVLFEDGRELLYGGAEVTVSTEVNG